MELDDDLDRAKPDHFPEMGKQIHRPVPCEERATSTSDRHPVEPGVGERNRLNHHGLDATARSRGAKQRRLEREGPVSVAAGPLREQYQSVASGKSFQYCVALDR